MAFSNMAALSGAIDAEVGNIEGALVSAKDGMIAGWARQPFAPDRPVTVEVYAAGVLLGSAKADRLDLDSLQHRQHGDRFRFRVDPKGLRPPYIIRARVAGSNTEIEGQINVDTEEEHRNALVPVTGSVIGIKDGCVEGWAFDKTFDNSPVELELSDVGRRVALCLASAEQPLTDHGKAGHGFRLQLPAEFLGGAVHSLSVKVANTSVELDGSPISFCLASTNGILSRFDVLEDGVRRLEARLSKQASQWGEAYDRMGRALAQRYDAISLVQRGAFEAEIAALRRLLVENATLDRTSSPQHPASATTVHQAVFDEQLIGYGWYAVERDVSGNVFRWMGETAAVVLDAAELTEAILTVDCYMMLDLEHAWTLRLTVNDVELNDRRVDTVNGRTFLRATIPAVAFRGRFCAVVGLQAAHARSPSLDDPRELSVAIASVTIGRAQTEAPQK